MTRRFGAMVAVPLLIGLATQVQLAQVHNPFAGAVIRHVGVIVADVDKAAASICRSLGPPQCGTLGRPPACRFQRATRATARRTPR